MKNKAYIFDTSSILNICNFHSSKVGCYVEFYQIGLINQGIERLKELLNTKSKLDENLHISYYLIPNQDEDSMEKLLGFLKSQGFKEDKHNLRMKVRNVRLMYSHISKDHTVDDLDAFLKDVAFDRVE